MALQSQLFRGDPKLEAAAVSDPAHILPGATGPHVGKIQLALIQLDAAGIAQDGVYGLTTAAAVLAYKRKRNIVNPNYQKQADNIVGKMTMAALDHEMLKKEQQPKPPVRRFRRYWMGLDLRGYAEDVELDTDAAAPRPILAFALPYVGQTAPSASDLIAKANGIVPSARSWINRAIFYLDAAKSTINPARTLSDKEQVPWSALETHFHLGRAAQSGHGLADIQALNDIQNIYRVMLQALKDNTLFKANLTPLTPRNAETFAGSFHQGKNQPTYGIFICPPFAGLWWKSQTAVVVHELAHFVGRPPPNEIGDLAFEKPAPNGAPNQSPNNYAQLTPAEARRNAASYATFAIHAAFGWDNR